MNGLLGFLINLKLILQNSYSMYHYSFNDCFEKTCDINDIKICLYNSLNHFKEISKKYPDKVKGILTDRSPNNILVTSDLFLSDVILSLGRDEKNYALKNFTKYPIEDFYPDLDIENILSNSYTLQVNKIHYDGFCAKINHIHDGFLFSLALHDDLKNNQLSIFENKENEILIDNMYGFQENSEYNIKKIEDKIQSSKVGFEKFITLFENSIYFKSFEDEFNGLTGSTQEAIYQKFLRAKERNLPTDFSADKDLIKDVTPDKEKEIKIYELRIFEPVCVRLYFFEESKEKIYLASVSKKPAKKVQSNDIRTSIALIKSLIKIKK